ncbi:thioesterase-like superfamily-domain-containing protein [Fusarium oxysporum f. sp. albedinis]|nr:thioesterase-like superfamily-domain-containing protein [Fusarium oxysporum f. sp. albedinis]
MANPSLHKSMTPKKATQTSNILELAEYKDSRQQWQPPASRGLYGGALIALCLSAAQKTVSGDFHIHSCHCFFLLAGSIDIRVIFHVERIRDGTTFATRRVEARQQGNSIATVMHSTFPMDDLKPPDEVVEEEPEWTLTEPFQRRAIDARDQLVSSVHPHQRIFRQWIRYKGVIPSADGPSAHLQALAFVTDSYFILTAARVHRLWRLPFEPEDVPFLQKEVRSQVQKVSECESLGSSVDDWVELQRLAMVASLDHTIYFHEPLRIKADDWMFAEMESPWAAHGRALVVQRIFSKEGTMLATCSQEGILRLKEDGAQNGSKL